jgi:hypothetical protein
MEEEEISDRNLAKRYTVLYGTRKQSTVKKFMFTYRETTERSGPD